MQIVEKSGEGLSRVFGVTVPRATLTERLDAKIAEIRPQMNLKGFRPGKVPAAHVRKMYGKSLMSEIIDQAVTDSQAQALGDGKLRAAAQPDIKVSSDMDQVMNGAADLAFDLEIELMPEFETIDLAKIKLERPIYEPTDAEVDEQLAGIAEQNRTYETKKGKAVKAAEGDMVVADFVGRIDGEVFEGGSMEDAEIVIGSGRFIPGFEEQLKGAKPGAAVTVKRHLPRGLQCRDVEGQTGRVRAAGQGDQGAEGRCDGRRFRQATRHGQPGRPEGRRARTGRTAIHPGVAVQGQAGLLDVLDSGQRFPSAAAHGRRRVRHHLGAGRAGKAAGELSDEDKAKTDDQLKSEYRKIAERRVRLGLVLAEIGRVNEASRSKTTR